MAPRWFKNINFDRILAQVPAQHAGSDKIREKLAQFEFPSFNSTGPIITEVESDDENISPKNSPYVASSSLLPVLDSHQQDCLESPFKDCPNSSRKNRSNASHRSRLSSSLQNYPNSSIQDFLNSLIQGCPDSPIQDRSDPLNPGRPDSPIEDYSNSPIHDYYNSPIQDCPYSPARNCPDSPTHDRPDSPTHDHPDSPTQDRPDSPTQDRPDSPIQYYPDSPLRVDPDPRASISNNSDNNKVRRSKRKRWAPLDFARGERPIYKRAGPTFEFAGIEKGFPEKYSYGRKKNPLLERSRKPSNARHLEPVTYKKAKKGNYPYILNSHNDYLMSGIFCLESNQVKPESKMAARHVYLFLVKCGEVLLKMKDEKSTTKFIANAKTNWFVLDSGKSYSMKNVGTKKAEIAYVVDQRAGL